MTGLAVAASWLWLGMVLAISFMEAPLKFRAPGLDLRTGLAIGRIVFRALNRFEILLAAVLVVGLSTGEPTVTAAVAGGVAVVALALQLGVVRPTLRRRSHAVLAGAEGSRSKIHRWYVALELAKVAALAVAGIALI